MFLSACLLMTALPPGVDAPGSPLTPEVPAVVRPTFYPGQVLDLSADGKLAVGSFHLGAYQQYLRIWDIETGAIVNDLHVGTADMVTSARFSPDGKLVAVGLGPHGAAHHVRVLDARGGGLVKQLRGFKSAGMVVGFSADGTKLYTVDVPGPGTNQSFKPKPEAWDLTTGKREPAEDRPIHPQSAETADRKTRLGRADNGKFVVTRAGAEAVTLANDNGLNYYGVFLTPDGRRAVISTHAWGYVFDATTGNVLRTLRTDSQVISSVAPADGGRLLFAAVTAGRHTDRRLEPEAGWVCVWDLTKPELRAVIPGLGHDLWKVQPTPDGKRFVTISGDAWRVNKVEVWDTAAKKRLREFEVKAGEGAPRGQAAVSPDGNWVAHVVWENDKPTLQVWNTDTGKPADEVAKAAGPTAGSLAFTPDSKRLVTVTDAEYAEWDVLTGKKEAGWKRGKEERPWFREYGRHATPLPGGKGVLTVGATGKRRQSYVLGLTTEKKEWFLGEFWDYASSPVVSADGRHVAVVGGGHREQSAYLLRLNEDGSPEMEDRTDRYRPPGGGDEKKSPAWRLWPVDSHAGIVAFAPDGKQLYTGGASHAVQIWDTATRELKATLYAVPAAKPGDVPTDWVVFTPAGHFVGTPTGEQVLRFRDACASTWFGLRPSIGTVPAAELPQLRDPARVKEAFTGK